MFIQKITAAAAAALAVLGSSGVAMSLPIYPDDVTSIRVPTAGIDVNSPAGAGRLLARVRAAASTICGGKPDARDFQRSAMFGVCVHGAVNRTVVTSGLPSLKAANGRAAIIVQASR